MNFRSAETSIPLSVGWLVRKMVYSSGEEEWVIQDTEPQGAEEFHGSTSEFKPALVKRIVFAEVK